MFVFFFIKHFSPSRLEFIICIMISNIKIFMWFKRSTFLNTETTITLNWWSSVPMVVLVVLQFSWFNFAFSFGSPCFRHSYNTKIKFRITNECFKIFKVCIEWTMLVQNRLKSDVDIYLKLVYTICYWPFKIYEKCFLFHLKSSFHFCPPLSFFFLPINHCFRGWWMIILKFMTSIV